MASRKAIFDFEGVQFFFYQKALQEGIIIWTSSYGPFDIFLQFADNRKEFD